jgi:hypothetical protein
MRTIPTPRHRPRLSRGAAPVAIITLLLACVGSAFAPVFAQAAVTSTGGAGTPQASTSSTSSTASTSEGVGTSLESAATKARGTARTVAMSLIGLGLAIASIVLAFRRDFKEAAGVFAVGIVAVLLATPTGLELLQHTVTSLFGS